VTDIEQQALSIYETICTTGGERPVSGHCAAQLMRALDEWRATNPGLRALRQAAPEVQLCFLRQSLDWLRVETRVEGNLYVSSAMTEAIQLAFKVVPKPLPLAESRWATPGRR